MRLIFFMLVCLGISACNKPAEIAAVKDQPAKTVETANQQIEAMLNEAKTELERKNFGKTIEIAIKITASDPKNAKAYYFESQAQSLTGAQEKAIKALEDAFKNGLEPSEEIVKNKNFDSIRESSEFKSLTRKYSVSKSGAAIMNDKEISAGNTSIKEEGGQQIIRAGDIVIKVPQD